MLLLLANTTSDWTETVALATGVLALGTFVLAIVTHFGNKGARVAEGKQLDVARRQLSASSRPAIVPFQEAAQDVAFRGGQVPAGAGPHIEENAPERSDLPQYSAALLAVKNVGVGPALSVRGTFQGPRGRGEVRFPTEAIEAGGNGVVVFENRDGESLGYSGNDPSVSAVVEYDDTAGQTYRTHIRFDVGNNAYEFDLETP